MSSKVANLIAIELAILIALAAWIAFSQLPMVKAQPTVVEPVQRVDSFAAVAPRRQERPRLRPPVDYLAEPSPEVASVAASDEVLPEAEEPLPNETGIPADLADHLAYTEAVPDDAIVPPDIYEDSLENPAPIDPTFVSSPTTVLVVISNSVSRPVRRGPRSVAPQPRARSRPARPPRAGSPPMVKHRPPSSIPAPAPPRRDSSAPPRRSGPTQAPRARPKVKPQHLP